MKKIFLLAILVLGMSLSGSAQEKNGIIYMKSPANYTIMAISQNGNWACGAYTDVDTEVSYGFRWNLITNKIDIVGESVFSGVSNDGTCVGSFYKTLPGEGSMECAGTWNEEWTMLERAGKNGTWATSITPDGQYVVGREDNVYTSYVWKDGKVFAQLASDLYNSVDCISDDGSLAGGWAYNPYTNKNRTSVYWTVNDQEVHYLMPTRGGQPWMSVKRFSPDNKKALFWGGYTKDPDNMDKGYGIRAILDLETNDTTLIYPIQEDGMHDTDFTPANFDFYDMAADGTVVGYQQNLEGGGGAIIWKDGVTRYLQDYLEELGADFESNGVEYIEKCSAVSADAKTFGLMYDGEDYSMTGNWYSMIVRLDQNVYHTAPVNITTEQMTGLLVTKLTWNEPLGDKTSLQGYNVYRNGEKVNTELVTDCEYYDGPLEEGSYHYTLIAVYEDGESDYSAVSTIDIKAPELNAPRNLTARQKGYNNAYASWDSPATNLADINYYDKSGASVEGFGGGDVSFESGILLPAKQMNLYKDYRLTAVSFYPLTEQGSWIINVYTRNNGELTLLRSFPVRQELQYGVKNTVMLSSQITLQQDHDLIIGIQTNVENASYSVQGVFSGCLQTGYTDLIRQVDVDEDFYSINEASNAGNLGTYNMAWGTAALLAPAGVTSEIDKIDHFVVTVDGGEPQNISDTRYCQDEVESGDHEISVKAMYLDGRESKAVSGSFNVTPNVDALKSITPNVEVGDDNSIFAYWENPRDDDATDLQYCGETRSSKAPKVSEGITEILARVDYPSETMRNYDGYYVNSVSFVPMTTCNYIVELFADEEEITEIELENPVVGEWNTCKFDDFIIIDKNKTYHYVIDCYDIADGEAPIALDNFNADGNGSYIMIGGEDSWYNVYYASGLNGNWMMKMNVASIDANEFVITGYDAYLDNELVMDNDMSSTYQATLNDGNHKFRVDAHYAYEDVPTVKGQEVKFKIVSDGIKEVDSNLSPLTTNLYNLAGQRVNNNAKGIIISGNKKVIMK